MRDQIQTGLSVAECFMERRFLMLCADKNISQSFGGLTRRAMADASGRFDAADVGKIHYLGFADLTKFGRLTAIEVNEVAQWCHTLLNQNADYSTLESAFESLIRNLVLGNLFWFLQPLFCFVLCLYLYLYLL